MMFADLHLHSRYSDGTFAPAEIVERARAVDLAAVSLTDHDTMEGCAEMRQACAAAGIEFIPGAELTVEHGGQEFHVLAYGVDEACPRLVQELVRFQHIRQRRIEDMVFRLNEHGILLSTESVFRMAECRSPGRPHVARALVAAKFCKTYDEAFEKFLKKGRPAWVAKDRFEVSQAVELIHAAGGVAVLAHPGLYQKDQVIPELAALGLDGIECWHTRHTAGASERYERMTLDLGLIATGGSDCHGMAKGTPLIGSVKVSYDCVTRIRARRDGMSTGGTVGT